MAPSGVVDGDVVLVKVFGQADRGHLDVIPVGGVPQGLQHISCDGLIDETAQVPGDDRGEFGPAVHQYRCGR